MMRIPAKWLAAVAMVGVTVGPLSGLHAAGGPATQTDAFDRYSSQLEMGWEMMVESLKQDAPFDYRGESWRLDPSWDENIGRKAYYSARPLHAMIRYAIRVNDSAKLEQLASFYLAYRELFTTMGKVREYNRMLLESLDELERQNVATIGDARDLGVELPEHFRLRGDKTTLDRVRRDLELRQEELDAEGPDSAPVLLWEDGGRLYRSIKSVNQFFLPAIVLMDHLTRLPATDRTQTMRAFVESYSALINNELINSMLEREHAPPGGSGLPNRSILRTWEEITEIDVRTAPPERRKGLAYKDYYWWLTANAVGLAGVCSRSRELCAIDDHDLDKLRRIGAVGVDYFLSKITWHRIDDWRGDEVPGATFGEGDWAYYDYHAYARVQDEQSPLDRPAPAPIEELTLDTGHTWRRLPKFIDVVSTHLAAAGLESRERDFAAASHGLINWFLYRTVHFADEDDTHPLVKNYTNWDGWYRVGHPGIPEGYPPSALTEVAFLDLGVLADWNADLRLLMETLSRLAASTHANDVAFRDRWYSEDFFVADEDLGRDTWRMIASLTAGSGQGTARRR